MSNRMPGGPPSSSAMPPPSVIPSQSSRSSQNFVSYVPTLPNEPSTESTRTPPSQELIEQMNSQRVSTDLIKYIEGFKYPYISDVSNYEKLLKIGQGTFGEVFKARCKKTGRMVALKKILMDNEKEGFPITALREVKMLQQLKHPNVTELIEVCSSKASQHNRERATFYLVFTFCEHDLAGLLCNPKIKLSIVHIKTMMKHLLTGLQKLHKAKILHRDMKAANVLITREGVLKLADFGLARPFIVSTGQNRQLYTNRVVTLWYRPPELLLGDRQYSTKIDLWGAGCIMAEMWTRQPIMQGDTEQRQLLLISNLCGSINNKVWPGVEALPYFKMMEPSLPQDQERKVSTKLGTVIKDESALKVLDELLTLDPSKRPDAHNVVYHDWFYKAPASTETVVDLMDLIPGSQFEFTAGRGAHANRGRAQRPQQQQQQQQRTQMTNVPAGQYRDMIF